MYEHVNMFRKEGTHSPAKVILTPEQWISAAPPQLPWASWLLPSLSEKRGFLK